MLALRRAEHFFLRLGVERAELEDIISRKSDFIRPLVLWDPDKPSKPRAVISCRGRLRKLQNRLLKEILAPKLRPTKYSYGGVKGRDAKRNALRHVRNYYLYKTDISDFFPSISHHRVYRLFTERLTCCPDVSHFSTELCTFNGHLALGLPTSPILSDQFLWKVDERIAKWCANERLRYTRFVDDIVISGKRRIRPTVKALITKVLQQSGFRVHKNKSFAQTIGVDAVVTGAQLGVGFVCVDERVCLRIASHIDDVDGLTKGIRPTTGVYFDKQQLLGKARYVRYIDPVAGSHLVSRIESLDWNQVEANAEQLDAISVRKELLSPGVNPAWFDRLCALKPAKEESVTPTLL